MSIKIQPKQVTKKKVLRIRTIDAIVDDINEKMYSYMKVLIHKSTGIKTIPRHLPLIIYYLKPSHVPTHSIPKRELFLHKGVHPMLGEIAVYIRKNMSIVDINLDDYIEVKVF